MTDLSSIYWINVEASFSPKVKENITLLLLLIDTWKTEMEWWSENE